MFRELISRVHMFFATLIPAAQALVTLSFTINHRYETLHLSIISRKNLQH